VRLFREVSFDLCFMDVRLPGANGVESLLRIRRFRPEAKIVIMTAFSVEHLLAEAVAGGALEVLSKPFATADLLRAIAKADARGVVLVVDDDGDFAEGLADALGAAGHAALAVGDGESALAALRERRVEVMVIDLRLPVRSGLEVCRELRRTGLDVPTVVVTGYPREEAAAIEALRSDAVRDVLVKPIDLPRLLAAVESARGVDRPRG
jgi:CheY-like chemotaxis protein